MSYLDKLYRAAEEFYLEEVVTEAKRADENIPDAEHAYHLQVEILEEGLRAYFSGSIKLREIRTQKY